MINKLRNEAIRNAIALQSMQSVIVDTETTGLDDSAEVIEISVLDMNKNVIFDSLVKPSNPIPEEATAIHGITNEDVKNAPGFAEIVTTLQAIFKNKAVLIYNSAYDIRILNQSSKISGIDPIWVNDIQAFCVMDLFSRFREIRRDNGDLKWHKLIEANKYFGFNSDDAHRAKADCIMTINVINGIAVGEQNNSKLKDCN